MKYFVTTAIPYVNAELHIGNAMDFLFADVLARYARVQGKQVIFSAGTDEHGAKIAEKAEEAGLEPKAFADKMSQNVRDVLGVLNVSNNRFIRTTDKGHEQRAQIIWQTLKKDIYKDKYTGWYCTGCEEYVTETTAKENNGICPDHDRKYEKLEEENYFFRLSKFSEQIQKAIENDSLRIIPETRKNEILNVIKSGLEDFSVSRPAEKIGWGIPVPDDNSQVMYVWFEALMNYITVVGYPEHDDFKKYWPADMQVIGKGILRFHAAIWPGILLSLGIELPKTLYVHGYATVDNKKISKTLGNAILPGDVIKEYGADAFRYYMLRHIPSYGDGDFSLEKLNEVYNNELANELGNAVQRTQVMIQKYQDGLIGDIPPAEHDMSGYVEAIENCQFDRALDETWAQVRGLNQYIEEEKPWSIAKTGDTEHLKDVLAYQVSCLLEIAQLLEPFLPETAQKIQDVFKEGVVVEAQSTLFPRKELDQ